MDTILKDAAVYVGTYAKYNQGSLNGKWLKISEKVFELLHEIDNLTESEQEAFFAWIENYGYDIEREDPYDLISKFKDAYVGQHDSEEDFAYEIIKESYDLPEFVKIYFDYNAFARDLFISDYTYVDGYVFSRN